jgi:hypothetical protein
LRLASIGHYRIYDCLHHLRVVTWVDARLFDARVGMVLHCHRLIRIICVYVFEKFFLGQRSSCLRVTCQPQSWGLGVKIIGDAQVVFPGLDDHDFSTLRLLLLLHRWLSEHIVVAIAEIVQVEHLIVFLPGASAIDNLHLRLIFIINVENLLLLLVSLLLRVLGIDPAILNVDLEVVCILLMELFELLDSLLARDSLGD